MRNCMWNRFPIKNLLIDSLLTPIVENTYLNKDMCKFESSQKDESRWQSTDISKAYRNTSAFKHRLKVSHAFKTMYKWTKIRPVFSTHCRHVNFTHAYFLIFHNVPSTTLMPYKILYFFHESNIKESYYFDVRWTYIHEIIERMTLSLEGTLLQHNLFETLLQCRHLCTLTFQTWKSLLSVNVVSLILGWKFVFV